MRFPDLRGAGGALAERLGAYRGKEEVVVLALVRGGVPAALEVASRLGAPLDLVLIRRLLAPRGPDTPVCAVNAAGTLVIDEEMPPRPAVAASALDHFIADALEGIAGRVRVCRGGRVATDLSQKTILLVDNGIHTGSTMRLAIRALRTRGPARIVAAVPVASTEGRAGVAAVADELVCLASPQPFGHVGLWYEDFRRPDDEQIFELLAQAAPRPAS